MATHNIRGREGEDLAERYLSARGYHVQHRNWRTSFYEIDVIAVKDNILHFIEVKTAHSLRFGNPESNVSKKKFNHIRKAATFYCELYPYWKRIQFDILSITRLEGVADEYLLIEDIYL